MKINYKVVLIWGAVLCASTATFAQESKADSVDLFELDLKDLMNIEIVSASKQSESLFDAPLSASVLTKEEMQRAGCTSIMEAFKLMPGLIVREQSNGNYDVHLRGLDNVPPLSTFAFSYNTTTLVMIDNRPVFNYYQGGTFWETLPVDLNDVERIEVVRGPSSAMYGPNAVSGVIHIITRKIQKQGMYTIANAQYGSNKTLITNASAGYNFNNKLSFIVSGNMQQRDRSQLSYYDLFSNTWVENVDSLRDARGSLVPNANDYYPNKALAMRKGGANAFINYNPTESTNIKVSAGTEDSEVQKIYVDGKAGAFSVANSNSTYGDIDASIKNIHAKVSYNKGKQQLEVGNSATQYNFNTLDALLEYSFVIKGLSIKPGLNYRKANYDDTPYSDVAKKTGIFNGNYEIETKAAYLRSEYKILNDKLRLIAALRVDQFNNPDKPYFSYQFSSNYKVNEKNMVRIVYARANRSPFINDTYIDLVASRRPSRNRQGRILPGRFNEIYVTGDTDLDLLTTDMIEIGFRSKIARNLQLDVEIFNSRSENFAQSVTEKDYVEIRGAGDTVTVQPIHYQNIPLSTRQNGVTISLNYITGKFQFKPFVTIQETKLKDLSEFSNLPDASPSVPATQGNLGQPLINNIYSGLGTTVTHKSTPKVFGGAYLNYAVNSKFNVNLNVYYFTAQEFYHRSYIQFRDGQRGVDNINAKFNLNACVSYKPIKQVSIFVSGKNLFGSESREFYRADEIGASYLAGINFEL